MFLGCAASGMKLPFTPSFAYFSWKKNFCGSGIANSTDAGLSDLPYGGMFSFGVKAGDAGPEPGDFGIPDLFVLPLKRDPLSTLSMSQLGRAIASECQQVKLSVIRQKSNHITTVIGFSIATTLNSQKARSEFSGQNGLKAPAAHTQSFTAGHARRSKE